MSNNAKRRTQPTSSELPRFRTLDPTNKKTIRIATQYSLGVAAKKLGVHWLTVKRLRRVLGIAPLRQRIKVPTSVLARLGTMSDAALSRQTGISEGVLALRRREAGIAAFSRAVALTLDPEARALIEALPVRAAATQLRTSRAIVENVRRALNLGPAPSGQKPITAFPKALIRQLGKVYDAELAKQFNYPKTTVRAERYRRGIQAVQKPKGREPIQIPTPILRRLGKAPDVLLAKAAGVTYQTIAARRKERGIPAYRP